MLLGGIAHIIGTIFLDKRNNKQAEKTLLKLNSSIAIPILLNRTITEYKILGRSIKNEIGC